jgi:hypothetical protein
MPTLLAKAPKCNLGLNARVFGTPSCGSRNRALDSRRAAWLSPITWLSPIIKRDFEKRLSEFRLAIRVLVDLADRLTAPACVRGGVYSLLSGRSRIDLNQRDIRRIAQRGCGRRLSLPCLGPLWESAPSRARSVPVLISSLMAVASFES